jgi:hypothetical protein
LGEREAEGVEMGIINQPENKANHVSETDFILRVMGILFQFYFKIASCNFEVVGCGESVVSPCYGYGLASVPCLSKCYAFRRDIRVAHSNSK